MGYAFNGICHASGESAFDAFNLQFPQVDAGVVTWLSSSSFAGGVITYALDSQPVTGGAVVSRSGSLTLTPCQTTTQGMQDVGGGLLFSMLTAFFIAFFLRKAIRKFASFGGGFQNDF